MKPSTAEPCIRSIASALPAPHWTTEELLSHASPKFSDKLISMMRELGVDNRHSILANYPEVLFKGAAPELSQSATGLAVEAARSCLNKGSVPSESIGLVLGVTSSPGRLLPSLVCDIFAQMPEIPRSANSLSVTYMGCSVIARVVETIRWYLTCNPGKLVLACFMDAITPLSPPLSGEYAHFTEIPATSRQETVNAMHGFLFGDAAVAILFGADGDGPTFGPVVGLTNELPEDAELGTVPDGGSDDPVVFGRRIYTLSPDVSSRGVYYASTTVRDLIASGGSTLHDPSDAAFLLMHTGSKRILHGLCGEFNLPTDSEKVFLSYDILRRYGNTLGCSVPLMLAAETPRPEGEGILMAFGLSFSCGALSMHIPKGGWTP